MKAMCTTCSQQSFCNHGEIRIKDSSWVGLEDDEYD
jgi:hypothetical protein